MRFPLTRLVVPSLLILVLAASLLSGCDAGPSEEDRVLEPVRQAYSQGFYMEARQGYERYLQLYPKGTQRLEAWERLLEIALNVEGDLDGAIAHLEAMILEFGDRTDSTWPLMVQLATLHEQRGNVNKALEIWEKGMELATGHQDRMVTVQMSMARLYRIKREYGTALELLTRCEKTAPDEQSRLRCLYEEAQTYSFMQSWGQAKEVLEVIVAAGDQAPEDIRTLSVFLLADVYEQEMDLARAKALFESIKDTYPNPKVIEIRLNNLGKGKKQQ